MATAASPSTVKSLDFLLSAIFGVAKLFCSIFKVDLHPPHTPSGPEFNAQQQQPSSALIESSLTKPHKVH